MKGPVALLAAAIAAAAVGVVFAIAQTRDTVPQKIRSCVIDGRGAVVRTNETLGQLRRDVEAGRVRVGRSFSVGGDRAVLVRGSGFRLLVVAGQDSAPLDADVARRAYLRPDRYSVVAVERDPLRVVETCARRARD